MLDTEREPEEMAAPQRESDGNMAAPPASHKRRRGNGKADGDGVPSFARGQPVATRKLADKKLRGRLKHSEALAEEAAVAAAEAHRWLLPDAAGSLEAEGLERTWQFSQSAIVQEVEAGAGRKALDLELGTGLGPYALDFTRSGRFVALAGRKGHLALLDWHRLQTVCEVQVKETVRDVHFLHNEQFFAVAQRKYAYIYDKRGLEVHCLKDHTEPKRLEFLPHHFLLASIGEPGVLHYQLPFAAQPERQFRGFLIMQDTSTGQIVAQHKTKLGPCGVLTQNPWNAVLNCGHAGGVVTMWTPNITTPVVRLMAHRGSVTAVAVATDGFQMVTAGADGQVRVWDLRALRPMHAYFSRSPAIALDISQRGMLAVGNGRKIQVWKDAITQKTQSPYLVHELAGGPLLQLSFCPYEDVLASGHAAGLSSMLVPGAGEPHYDSRVADPFQGRAARREMEVAHLLDKLQPDMITLGSGSVAQVRREPKEVQKERQAEASAANAARLAAQRAKADEKTKMKGKNRPSRRQAKKQHNIIEAKKPELRKRIAEEQKAAGASKYAPNTGKTYGPGPKSKQEEVMPEGVPRALQRFYKKA